MSPGPSPHSAGRWWILGAVALCLALRLFYVFVYSDGVSPERLGGDAADYVAIAWTLAETGQYGRPLASETEQSVESKGALRPIGDEVEVVPDGWRPPGWPFVLAILLFLTGSLTGAYLGRFLIDCLALWMLALLVPRFELGRWGARSVLVLAALHPTWLIYSASMLSEALTLAFLVATLWTGFRLTEAPSVGRAMLAGSCAAGLVLTHPFQLLVAFVLIGLWAKALLRPEVPRSGDGTSLWRVVVTVIVAFLLPLAAWILRNQFVLGHASLTTSSDAVLPMSWSEEFLAVYDNGTAEVRLPEGQVTEYLQSNWRQVPAVLARKTVGALGPFVESRRAGILEAGRATWWFIGSMTFWCVILSRGRGAETRRGRTGGLWHSPSRFLVATYLGYLAMAMLTYPSIRFRAPLAPVEVLLLVSVVMTLGRGMRDLGRTKDPSTRGDSS